MAEEMRPLYLIAGTDGAKIDATRARLRARAEREGGAAALEVFEPGEGRGAPDHEALLAAIPAMSLTESRRYLLADGVERWRDRQLDAVAAALGELPPDLTVVLIARAKAPAKLARAVKAAKGEIHEFEAPKAREMPRVLVAEAEGLGFRLDPGRRPHAGRAHGRQPAAPPQRARAPRALGGRGGRGRAPPTSTRWSPTPPRRPSGRSPTPCSNATREGAGDRRAADLPGRERHRLDLRPRLAAAQGLRGGGEARGGSAAEAGRVEPRHAPLRGQAAGRAGCGTSDVERPAGGDRSPSPTSRSGAAAAPTTATSWR